MKEVLDETYGIMVYQEQVMQICNRLGDIPLREAYTLIKAISKKKASTILKEKERFVAGSVAKGLKKQQAEDIFALIERFALCSKKPLDPIRIHRVSNRVYEGLLARGIYGGTFDVRNGRHGQGRRIYLRMY
jgi:hypothetical protein